MPIIIYLFAISAFALGLAEFLPMGLTEIIADDLAVGIENVGRAVTAYALGATVSAPILTALTANLPRKSVMLISVSIFSLGSFVAAVSVNLDMMLLARFVAGLGHGLFLAVASSTAAQLVGNHRAGSAVAIVFSGFTLAMAIGVPLSTYLGSVLSWHVLLGMIAFFGIIGGLGLGLKMQDPLNAPQHFPVKQNLKRLGQPILLLSTLVTVFSYAGAFTAYTYIAPFLTQITGVSSASVAIFLFIYGVAAAAGNIIGGKLTDRFGEFRANGMMIIGLIFTNILIGLIGNSFYSMIFLTALLGALTFGIVPSLQARLIRIAAVHAPESQSVAAGLNIAGFNLGIAFGSFVGGIVVAQINITASTFAGALLSFIGLILLIKSQHSFKSR